MRARISWTCLRRSFLETEKIPFSTKEVSCNQLLITLELLLLGVTKRRSVSANWTCVPQAAELVETDVVSEGQEEDNSYYQNELAEQT